MKKIVLCLLVAIVMSNCQVSVNKANANDNGTMRNIACNKYECVGYEKVTIEGMEMAVFFGTHSHTSPFVLNLTKEKLEIELLRKQLQK